MRSAYQVFVARIEVSDMTNELSFTSTKLLLGKLTEDIQFSRKPSLNIKTNHSNNVFFVKFDPSGIVGNE